MGDVGDYWRDTRGYYQEKRAKNTASSTAILEREKIPFTSHNGGVHLVICDAWDFWPSTGLFIERATGKKGRGVFNLLKLIRKGLNYA